MSENTNPSEKPYDAAQDPDADPAMLDNRRPGSDAPDEPAEGADDAATEAADSGPEVEAAPEEAAPRNDGIVRDADGDGVPDDAGGGCEGKNETQCQITAGCAWSDTGECVDAGM